MQEKNQKKNKKKGCLLLGILLILIGTGMVLIKYYQRNEIQDLEENNINDFYELQEEISSNQENEIKQEKIEMARKLLQNNFSVQMIVELTELTEEEINEIKLELH